MTVRIDLNADLGESFGTWVLGDDEAMLDVVTSANVACGFHAGDATTIRRTVAAAAERGVVVGAQVGYRDLAGFGRRRIDMDPADLTADVLYQLGALEAMCRVAGTRVAYVKPHGALYTTAAVDEVPGTRRRGCRGRLRPHPPPPRPPGLGAPARRRGRGPHHGGRGVRRPRVRRHRPPRPPVAPGGAPHRPRRRRRAGRPARDRGHRARRRRHASSRSPPGRSARTGTPRMPSRWPARCARPSRRPGSRSRRSSRPRREHRDRGHRATPAAASRRRAGVGVPRHAPAGRRGRPPARGGRARRGAGARGGPAPASWRAGDGPWSAVTDVVPAARTVLLVDPPGHRPRRPRPRPSATSPRGCRSRHPGPAPSATAPGARGRGARHLRRPRPRRRRPPHRPHPGRGRRRPHGTPWRVAFGGFAPGFAYLVGGDPRAASAAPRPPATVGARRGRRVSPASSPGSTRGPPPAAGSCSARRPSPSGTSTATRPRCSRPAPPCASSTSAGRR